MRSPTQKVSGFNGGWLYNGRECIRSQSFRATAVSTLLVVSVSKVQLKPVSAKLQTPHMSNDTEGNEDDVGYLPWSRVMEHLHTRRGSMCSEFAGAKHVRFKNICSTGGAATRPGHYPPEGINFFLPYFH